MLPHNDRDFREHLLSMYTTALRAVNGQQRVAHYLREQAYKPTAVAVIALGKAAEAMTKGAFEVLESAINRALIITKHGHLNSQQWQAYPVTCVEASHPVPDKSSLLAGQLLLDFIADLPVNCPVLCLISGGTSALVEVLAPNITLTDLQQVNQWLLANGVDIHTINQIRKRLSAIKGGRLATYLQGHPVLNLLISDVPNDDLKVIGSGLLTAHEDNVSANIALPDWLKILMKQALPLAEPHYFSTITQDLLATPATARHAAEKSALQLGYRVRNHETLLIGDALYVGHTLAQRLSTATSEVSIWSSETTVNLPAQPGQGGRCQSLALATAFELAKHTGIYLLAAGTDGYDGSGEVAGALIDGGTLTRGQQAGLNARQCLDTADAGRFLAASGDLVYTGPTNTNVMDIIIGLKVGD